MALQDARHIFKEEKSKEEKRAPSNRCDFSSEFSASNHALSVSLSEADLMLTNTPAHNAAQTLGEATLVTTPGSAVEKCHDEPPA